MGDVEAFRLVFEVDVRQKRVVQVEFGGFVVEQLFESGLWIDIGGQQRSPQPLKIGQLPARFRCADTMCHRLKYVAVAGHRSLSAACGDCA